MAGFFRIMELWGAGNMQTRRILGGPPEQTFYQWKSGRVRRLPEDTLQRIGYVTGAYEALQILYSDPAQADQWVRKPNRHFAGQIRRRSHAWPLGISRRCAPISMPRGRHGLEPRQPSVVGSSIWRQS
jgi:hypothetical protein